MLKRLIRKISNSELVTWFREAKLLEIFNIFGILTVYKRVLFIIADSHDRASETSFLAIIYQLFGFIICGKFISHEPFTSENPEVFFGWAFSTLTVFVIWFFLPWIWKDYEKKYNKEA